MGDARRLAGLHVYVPLNSDVGGVVHADDLLVARSESHECVVFNAHSVESERALHPEKVATSVALSTIFALLYVPLIIMIFELA